MSTQDLLDERRHYEFGFVTAIDSETIPKGLSEETVLTISRKKNEPQFLTDFRLKAFRALQDMKVPSWDNITHPPIDLQNISYYSEPK